MKKEALPKKVAVLKGGPGSERDVSLATAAGVSKALRSLGIEVVDVAGERLSLGGGDFTMVRAAPFSEVTAAHRSVT